MEKLEMSKEDTMMESGRCEAERIEGTDRLMLDR
jgi:hypothetical protein